MRPGSREYKRISLISYLVLALVLLGVGLLWRAEKRGQVLRQQQAVEQAQAEQWRLYYQQELNRRRWQVGQRAPRAIPKPKPAMRSAPSQGPVHECVMRHLAAGFRIVDQSAGALDDSWADKYATQQACQELGLTRKQLEAAELEEATRWLNAMGMH